MELIPHPDQQLKISQFQKQLIKEFSKDFIIYDELPVWIHFNNIPEQELKTETKQELQSFSKKIESVDLSPVDFSPDKMIFFTKTTIKLKDGTFIETDFVLAHILSEKSSSNFSGDLSPISSRLKKICRETNLFPCRLNIFRICETINSSANFRAIGEFQWVKLNRKK